MTDRQPIAKPSLPPICDTAPVTTLPARVSRVASSPVQRTKLCRCEVSHESDAGVKNEGSGSAEPAHRINRRSRARNFKPSTLAGGLSTFVTDSAKELDVELATVQCRRLSPHCIFATQQKAIRKLDGHRRLWILASPEEAQVRCRPLREGSTCNFACLGRRSFRCQSRLHNQRYFISTGDQLLFIGAPPRLTKWRTR
ncbi:hypothetical protein EVAR_43098_1 [Eumeta japonica]|uniref:Uncharacterized protein n=1 Tax=Eumeta variegata TaxID=151549 RepID=A0A4C1WXF3_EUMVA|nr:hypothetical protein EVAR_43098_1 [Eumeta japonica]